MMLKKKLEINTNVKRHIFHAPLLQHGLSRFQYGTIQEMSHLQLMTYET